jgi:hypothetical protein
MDRPESKYAWRTNHLKWVEYADALEAENAKLREYRDKDLESHKLRVVMKENAKLRKALESMATVLCNPDGECCIDCCDADKAVINLAMAALEIGDELD